MTSGGDDSVRIPLEWDADTSGLDRAQQAAERFDGTAAELQQTLARLQRQAVDTFNALQKLGVAGGGKGSPVSSYADLQALAPVLAGPAYAPVTSTMAQVEALSSQTPRTGAESRAATQEAREEQRRQSWINQQAAREQADKEKAQRRNVVERDRLAAQNARDAEHAAAGGGHGAVSRPFSERLTDRVLRTGSLATLGAFAAGDFASGGRSLARAFIEALALTQVSRRAATTIATAAAGSALSAGATGGIGATEEGAAGAGLLGLLTTGPVGAILAGIAGSVAVGLGVNAVRAQVRGQEYSLRASIGGAAGADMGGVAGGVLGVGQRFLYDPKTAYALANQLGTAGVGLGQLGGAEGSTMAMARLSGMDPAQIAQVTAALIVQGHASATEVAAVFQTLRQGAERSGLSLTRLVSSLQDFQRITGGAALGVSGAAGLAAVQGLTGPAANVGGLLGPAFASKGDQAFTTAGVLGISVDKLAQLQRTGDTAQMFDIMAAAARRISGGRTDQTGVNVVESVFQRAGVLDTANISPTNAANIIRRMMTQGPRAAEDARDAALAAAAQQTAVARAHALQDAGTQAAQDITSAAQKIVLSLNYAAQQIALYGNTIGAPTAGGPPQKTRTGFNLQAPGGRPDSLNALPGGLLVPNTRGQSDLVGMELLADYQDAAQKYGVPLGLLLTLGARESDFHSSAVNPRTGARGQMQFLPSTLDMLRKQQGSPIYGMTQQQALAAAADPRQSTALGAYYLSSLHGQMGNDWQRALGAYGEGPAYARSVFTAGQALELRFSNNPPTVPVQLQGTLTVVSTGGTFLGTAKVAPMTAHINLGRQPKGGVKGSGPPASAPPAPPHADTKKGGKGLIGGPGSPFG